MVYPPASASWNWSRVEARPVKVETRRYAPLVLIPCYYIDALLESRGGTVPNRSPYSSNAMGKHVAWITAHRA